MTSLNFDYYFQVQYKIKKESFFLYPIKLELTKWNVFLPTSEWNTEETCYIL